MRILLSNDDGYLAPGLKFLAGAVDEFADITVVAPDRNRSGASNSLTLATPLRARRAPNGFFFIDGTPTDCVHIAITGLMPEEPDMVIAGINAGANLGDDVLYSGTVAAATEGRFLGLPAIAVSLTGTLDESGSWRQDHFDTAALHYPVFVRMIFVRRSIDLLWIISRQRDINFLFLEPFSSVTTSGVSSSGDPTSLASIN